VLYVAFTRAELELRAFLPQNDKLAGKSPALRAVAEVLDAMGVETGGEPAVFGPPPSAPQPVVAPLQTPAVCAPCSGQVLSQEPDEAPGPDAAVSPPLAWIPRLKVYRNAVRDLRASLSFTEKKRGVLAHAAAERFQRLYADGRPADEARDRALDLTLMDAPPDPALREKLRVELAGMLDWLVSRPGFDGYLRTGVSERDILDAKGEKRRPDLMVRLPETTVIIDYKTGAASDEHVVQVRRYLKLARALAGAPADAVGYLAYLDLETLREVRLEDS